MAMLDNWKAVQITTNVRTKLTRDKGNFPRLIGIKKAGGSVAASLGGATVSVDVSFNSGAAVGSNEEWVTVEGLEALAVGKLYQMVIGNDVDMEVAINCTGGTSQDFTVVYR